MRLDDFVFRRFVRLRVFAHFDFEPGAYTLISGGSHDFLPNTRSGFRPESRAAGRQDLGIRNPSPVVRSVLLSGQTAGMCPKKGFARRTFYRR